LVDEVVDGVGGVLGFAGEGGFEVAGDLCDVLGACGEVGAVLFEAGAVGEVAVQGGSAGFALPVDLQVFGLADQLELGGGLGAGGVEGLGVVAEGFEVDVVFVVVFDFPVFAAFVVR
jgi:hypothetical protein